MVDIDFVAGLRSLLIDAAAIVNIDYRELIYALVGGLVFAHRGSVATAVEVCGMTEPEVERRLTATPASSDEYIGEAALLAELGLRRNQLGRPTRRPGVPRPRLVARVAARPCRPTSSAGCPPPRCGGGLTGATFPAAFGGCGLQLRRASVVFVTQDFGG